MQKGKNTILALSLFVLIVISFSLFFFARENPRADLDRDHFKIKETEKIDHVVLKSRSAGSNVDLAYDNNRWRVNDKWDADLQLITVLFATIRQAEPRRPVASAFQDSVKKLLRASGTLVTFSAGGVDQMRLLAGGNLSKTEAWFLREEEDEAFIMMIPGYRVYVSGIFELDENGWRNKMIFQINWRNLKSVTASYSKEPLQGFKVEMEDRVLAIRELPDADTTKLNDYVDAVSLLAASRFLPSEGRVSDSLKNEIPAVKIEILDVGDRSYRLDIFAPQKNDREVFARMGDGQLVTIDRSEVEAIVRRKDYFNPSKANP